VEASGRADQRDSHRGRRARRDGTTARRRQVHQADKPGLGAAHDVWGGIVMRKRVVVAAALAAALALLFAATAHADCGVVIHCTPTGGGRSGYGESCAKTTYPPCVYTSPVKAPPAESRQPTGDGS
jgi:hypothetical protein